MAYRGLDVAYDATHEVWRSGMLQDFLASAMSTLNASLTVFLSRHYPLHSPHQLSQTLCIADPYLYPSSRPRTGVGPSEFRSCKAGG